MIKELIKAIKKYDKEMNEFYKEHPDKFYNDFLNPPPF